MPPVSPTIGVLFTETPLNANKDEQRYGLNIWESLKVLNANPVAIDYYKDINIRKILNDTALPVFLNSYSSLFSSEDVVHNQKLLAGLSRLLTAGNLHQRNLVDELSKLLPTEVMQQEFTQKIDRVAGKIIKKHVEKILEDKKIEGVFLPGDWYNYDTEPFHPEPKAKPRIIKALVEIAKERGMPIMGVCGGLQGVMAAEDVAIKRVKLMVGPEKAKDHLVSEPDSNIPNELLDLSLTLRRTEVSHGTRLANVISKAQGIKSDGQYSVKQVFFHAPEAHGGAIDLNPANLKKLEEKGYRITAKSPDGIIQGVEHKDYPIQLFQNHPEDMVRQHDPVSKSVFNELLLEPARKYAMSKQQAEQKVITPEKPTNWVEKTAKSTTPIERGRGSASPAA